MGFIAVQMGEYIRTQIKNTTEAVFKALNVPLELDNIWHDFAEVNGSTLRSTFYVKGVDNVPRKEFNTLAEAVKVANPLIREFKVKYKRPNKEVRFYIHLGDLDESEGPQEG